MSFANRAVFIPAKGEKLQVGPSGVVEPGLEEILVKNHAWGINPIDWKMQSFGLRVESYPSCLGNDIAGEVAAVGKGVSKMKVGDRVLALASGNQSQCLAEHAFQLYTIVSMKCAIPMPHDMDFETAAKLPLGIVTAAAGLYNSEQLKLPLPQHAPQRQNQTLLVWGGSSNVGAAAIQLALASSLDVVTTASLANHEMVKGLGATKVFDHSSASVEDDLMDYLGGRQVVGAFDAIGTPQTTSHLASVLSRLGGGKISSVLPNLKDLPATVTGKQIFAPSVFLHEPDVGEAVWENFLPQALRSGQFRAALKTKVAGHGLEAIQVGLDMLKKGVSGGKVVVLA